MDGSFGVIMVKLELDSLPFSEPGWGQRVKMVVSGTLGEEATS
jgi:hypothetical protein